MLPEIRTILYPTDLDPRAPEVFRYTMSLAHRYDAKIVLLHVVEPLTQYARSVVEMYLPEGKGNTLREEARDRILADLHTRLRHFCQDEVCIDLGGDERVSEIRVLEGNPTEVILAEAKRVGADLLVLGAHRHTAVGEMLLGSVSHKVLQRAPVPVLLVRLP
ncbi:MAG TPA: universal stress protein [Deferrisomatales bacterium]|nr:universal stress protein [Deferrisomatales bacterium]